jgi:flagellar basal-body rod modification protein FlgD
MRVSYGGSQVELGQQGGANIAYALTQGADEVTITIRNASGAVVRTTQGPAGVGNQTFGWDGLGDNGQRLPAGAYSVDVVATGADGSPVQVSRGGSGIVDGVETTADGVQLSIGGATVPLADVSDVTRPAS